MNNNIICNNSNTDAMDNGLVVEGKTYRAMNGVTSNKMYRNKIGILLRLFFLPEARSLSKSKKSFEMYPQAATKTALQNS